MPYPKFAHTEEDPEEVAEREFEKRNADLGLPDSRPARKSLPAAPQPSRGRFDMGLDEYIFDEDVDEHTEDIEQDVYNEFCKPPRGSNSSRSMGFGSMESDSEASNDSANVKTRTDQVTRVRDVLLASLSPNDDGFSEQSLADLFSEEYDETGRVKLLHDAVSSICNKRAEIVDDPKLEYRLVSAVARLMQQGLLKSSSVINYVECAQNRDHGWELLSAATVSRPKDWSAKALLEAVEKLATELATEYDTKDVAEDLSGRDAPFFHANFVSQVGVKIVFGGKESHFCLDAITSMNMDVIYFVSTALKDFLNHGTLSPWAVNIGFERFFKNIHAAEMDLPGATSLATMLMSYAANDVVIIDESTASTCPKPTRFIKVGPQGKLSVVENGHEECNEMNYFIMNQ
ncbi:unnamed protein product [Strongylus vulgaris]|uniref:Uncharacterized protein n=1 Tax=Strongylus vulgaris TaxID=40348 RepID=A0A3P7IMU7_STRVU|nr:unnamed protein product [Strongylus vulgaris]